MKTKVLFVIQLLMGLIFFVFGLNGFLNFIPQPPLTGTALTFFTGMMAAPYFIPVLKGTEVLVGLALLTNRFVALALVVIAPIILQIFLYHTIVDPSGAPMAIALVVFLITLMISKSANYKTVLAAK